WNNSSVLEGDLDGEVAKLKERYDGDVVVHGSAQLAQALIERDLVDELRLMVFPVVLGSGKRLFGESADKKRLELVDTKIVGDGVEADPVTARDQLQAGREAELRHRRGEAARLAERGRAGCYGRALCREAEQTADVVGEGHCRNGNHRCGKRGYQSTSAWPEVA